MKKITVVLCIVVGLPREAEIHGRRTRALETLLVSSISTSIMLMQAINLSGGIYSCLASFSQGANMLIIDRNVHRWFDQAAVLITLSHRLVLAVARLFRESRFVIHASGKLRRLGLVHFQKEYVRRQLSARQGACRQCATCCNLLFTCPMLTKRGRCLVYGTCRPQACKTFPIDQRDIDEVNLYGDRCGYNFRDTLAINTKQRGSA